MLALPTQYVGLKFPYTSIRLSLTLGVVGVVRVLVADAHNTSRGPKCQILTKNPPFSFFQNKAGCPPYPYKKFERKSYL